jgi:2-aminoadipate transaminase
MRLNFSGVGEEEIREGVRRIGNVIAEQMDLYRALAGGASTPGLGGEARRPAEDENVLPFRKTAEGE